MSRRKLFRLPGPRAELRKMMMDRLRKEVLDREVNELADQIGIGKTKPKRVRRKVE